MRPDRRCGSTRRCWRRPRSARRPAADKDYEQRLQAIVEAARATGNAQGGGCAEPEEGRTAARDRRQRRQARARPGQELQNVVSVAMLSEGWDAKNVTHIMGLRAFTSQLLCEQVIGRGLRRVSLRRWTRTGCSCPSTSTCSACRSQSSMPSVKATASRRRRPSRSIADRSAARAPRSSKFAGRTCCAWISVVRPVLAVDWDKVQVLTLHPEPTPTAAQMAPVLGGVEDWSKVTGLDLKGIAERFRLQHLVFHASRKAFEQIATKAWKGEKHHLIVQIVRIVERFMASDRLEIPGLFNQEPLRRRVLLAMNVDRVVEHVCQFIREENSERLEPVFDPDYPIGSTARMRTWYTSKPCQPTGKSQISHAVFDSTWEAGAVNVLETSDAVSAYAKNDHLGFWVLYMHNGVVRKYFPDFLIRLASGRLRIVEVQGQPGDDSKAKHAALDLWVKAVNQKGGFGEWGWAVVDDPAKTCDVLVA
ncbi:MAG: hypothetical protein MZV70_46840 [Desulfobacterales bacterium]|nr:hypothetical protein [Desulfobacterales bacterium]